MGFATIGIRSDVKRFKTRKKAEDFIASLATLGQPPLPNPTSSIVTDGSASKVTASAGWGAHIQQRESCPVDLWGPASAFFHALQWITSSRFNSDPRKDYNLLPTANKAHSCENVTEPVTFFQKMSYRGYILFRIHFHSNFF